MKRNNVLFYMQLIKDLGGSYEPFRDFFNVRPKKHTDGRRETRRPLRYIKQ